MKIVTAAEMREIDRSTTERFGIPSLSLMDNAGSAVADFVSKRYRIAETVGVICGKGNNGGDGFVAARRLHAAGLEVQVLLLADPAELKGDAAANFSRLPVGPILRRSGCAGEPGGVWLRFVARRGSGHRISSTGKRLVRRSYRAD